MMDDFNKIERKPFKQQFAINQAPTSTNGILVCFKLYVLLKMCFFAVNTWAIRLEIPPFVLPMDLLVCFLFF